MQKTEIYIFALLVTLVFFNCKKKKVESVPQPPIISVSGVNPANVKEFRDSVVITIHYKDQNGDLGDENPDEHSLEVKDSRLQRSDVYHIQPLAPITTSDIPIEGDLRIKLNSMFLLGTGTSEQAILSIKIKDRAGNWSNEVSTQALTITK